MFENTGCQVQIDFYNHFTFFNVFINFCLQYSHYRFCKIIYVGGGNVSEDIITIKIQGDSEGYVTFECPFCNSEFKLQAGEYQNEDEPFEELFCPYCGLVKEKDQFLSSEVIEQAQAIAYNHLVEELNSCFKKMQKSINKSKGLIKMDYKPLKKVVTKELKDKDTTETEFACSCCSRRTKVLYCAGASIVFCPYCGVDI